MQQALVSRLHEAARVGDFDLVQELISRGVAVDGLDEFGRTALMLAAYGGHVQVVEWLIEQGADVWRSDNNGHLPLLHANAELPGEIGNTPGQIEAAQAVGRAMREKADPQYLHAALSQAADGDVAWAFGLIAAGADVNGWPLIFAIQAGELEIVRAMVEVGADVNGVCGTTTPLMRAVEARYPEVVRALIDAGADVNQPTPDGNTPLQAAMDRGESENFPGEAATIQKLLTTAGATL